MVSPVAVMAGSPLFNRDMAPSASAWRLMARSDPAMEHPLLARILTGRSAGRRDATAGHCPGAGFSDPGAGQPLQGWQTPDGHKTDAATWLAPEALPLRTGPMLASPDFMRK